MAQTIVGRCERAHPGELHVVVAAVDVSGCVAQQRPGHGRVHRRRSTRRGQFRHDRDHGMLDQIVTNGQPDVWSDARAQQDRRRVDRSSGDDDLIGLERRAIGGDDPIARRPSSATRSTRTPPSIGRFARPRAGSITRRGRHPTAGADVERQPAQSGRAALVIVVAHREAQLHQCRAHRVVERCHGRSRFAGDRQRPSLAVIIDAAEFGVIFESNERSQHLCPTPPVTAELAGPRVVVIRCTASAINALTAEEPPTPRPRRYRVTPCSTVRRACKFGHTRPGTSNGEAQLSPVTPAGVCDVDWFGPASISKTCVAESCDNRAANTAPADPAPTTITSNLSTNPPSQHRRRHRRAGAADPMTTMALVTPAAGGVPRPSPRGHATCSPPADTVPAKRWAWVVFVRPGTVNCGCLGIGGCDPSLVRPRWPARVNNGGHDAKQAANPRQFR